MSILRDKIRQTAAEEAAISISVEKTGVVAQDKDTAAAVSEISRAISEKHREQISKEGLDRSKGDITESIATLASEYSDDYETRKKIEVAASATILGLGPIDAYMKNPDVTEIIVQRYNNICVEIKGIVHKTKASFNDENHLVNVINRIVQPVGRTINLSTPIVDARLPNGSRVNATIPPVTPDGATLTIRKFSDEILSAEDFIRLKSFNMTIKDFLKLAVEGKLNIIVSGGTSTGKTTLLNVLSRFIPDNELIVTIEDSCELNLLQSNVRRMEARQTNADGMMRIDIQALVKNALRMRPDRIIVGEIRDGAVVDMMTAMSTGHEGSMSTVHANSPEVLVNTRLPILYSMYQAAQFSEISQAYQICDALDLIVQIERMIDGSRKITRITHVVKVGEDNKPVLNDVFVYDPKTDEFLPTGYIPRYLIKKCKLKGVVIPESLFKKTVQNEGSENV